MLNLSRGETGVAFNHNYLNYWLKCGMNVNKLLCYNITYQHLQFNVCVKIKLLLCNKSNNAIIHLFNYHLLLIRIGHELPIRRTMQRASWIEEKEWIDLQKKWHRENNMTLVSSHWPCNKLKLWIVHCWTCHRSQDFQMLFDWMTDYLPAAVVATRRIHSL